MAPRRSGAGRRWRGWRTEVWQPTGCRSGAVWSGRRSFGIGASGHGRDYRLGYGLGVLSRESLEFELGVDANRRESPSQGTAEHGVLGRLTARW